MQQGGGMPSFVSYTNVPQPQPSYTPNMSGGEQPKQGEEEGEGLLDKNMIKMLYEQGLPSDVEKFVNSSMIFGDPMASPFDKNSTTTKYRMILQMLPKIRTEGANFEKALDTVRKNDGLSEIAVSPSGYVVTMGSEGQLAQRLLSDVNPEEERILTNSELADYRTNNPNAAFNSSITSVISNGIGMSKINDYIQGITDKIGSSTIDRDGYVSVKNDKISKGIEYLKSIAATEADVSGMDMAGVYKVGGLTGTQAQQAQQALKYIIDTLPTNMKTVLQAKAMMSGEDPRVGMQKLVMGLVSSSLDETHQFRLDYEKDLAEDGSKKSGTGGKDETKMSAAEAIALGKGPERIYSISNGTSNTIKALGQWYPVTTSDGKPLGEGVFKDLLKSSISGTLDFNSASMDGKLLENIQMDRIVQDGSGLITVDLPIDPETSASGFISPNLELLKDVEKADKEIRDNNIEATDEKNKIYAKHNLPAKYGADGKLDLGQYHRFAVINAFADATAFSESPEMSDWVSQVEDSNVENSMTRILSKEDKNYKTGDIYKGSVYVPVRNSLIAASMTSGNSFTIPETDASTVQALDQAKQRQSELRSRHVNPPKLSIQ